MRLAYVGARLKAIGLVRKVQEVLIEKGYVIDYDWTNDGSARGDEIRMRQIAAPMIRAAGRADIAVFLLVNGEKSPQAGLHVELGAALHGGAQICLWAPSEHAYLLDPTHPRCKSFYVHPSVFRITGGSEEQMLAAVGGWAVGARESTHQAGKLLNINLAVGDLVSVIAWGGPNKDIVAIITKMVGEADRKMAQLQVIDINGCSVGEGTIPLPNLKREHRAAWRVAERTFKANQLLDIKPLAVGDLVSVIEQPKNIAQTLEGAVAIITEIDGGMAQLQAIDINGYSAGKGTVRVSCLEREHNEGWKTAAKTFIARTTYEEKEQ